MISKKLFSIDQDYIKQEYHSNEYNINIQIYYCKENKKCYEYLDIGFYWLNREPEVNLITSYKRYKFLSAFKKSVVKSIVKVYKKNKRGQPQTWLILGTLKRRPIQNCKLINIFNLQNLLQIPNIPNLLSVYFTKDQQQYWLKKLNYIK